MRFRSYRGALAALFLVGLLALPSYPVLASDHYNLEEGLPVEVEDSIPTAYLNREIQGFFRWERTGDDKDRFQASTILEYGFMRNAQAELEIPFLWGDGTRKEEGLGDVSLSGLYNFNQETPWIPGVALKGSLDLPTDEKSAGVDTTLKLIASKTLGRSTLWNRLHLNASWKHNNEAKDDEREDYYVAVVGWDVRVGPDSILIIDFIREQQEEKNKESNIVETGLRYQLTPLTVLAAGVGAGIGDDSPEVRTTLAFQHSF
ncbi:MAG: transporter [Acidobacteriota bacterium]